MSRLKSVELDYEHDDISFDYILENDGVYKPNGATEHRLLSISDAMNGRCILVVNSVGVTPLVPIDKDHRWDEHRFTQVGDTEDVEIKLP